ncbi:MAG: family 20 glycosylhydrolase [Muribaculaceae bacterium]|nr:family 20 glycosylhydrolase [Muribaculaceae bacterium]
MKYSYFLIIAMLITSLKGHAAGYSTDIIPKPASITVSQAKPFKLKASTTLYIDAPEADKAHLASYIASVLPQLTATPKKSNNQIRLEIASEVPGVESAEGYLLTVGDKLGVTVKATGAQGLFYGMQSVIQLLEENGGDIVPPVTVTDNPRFGYRGMMIDVSRNFRDKEFIKKQIDAMARLKLNTLQFHLTDGAGWRLQIDRYPRLTEYAAWRPADTWKEWTKTGSEYCESTDPGAHGGYYTKDDIKDILAYAAYRYITVIPEIEMPSHSEEVTAAYPELSCTHNPKGTSDFCPGNEKTFEFIENVLDEVIELFPSKYINIGGDEAPKTNWRTCELCKARMEAEGLESVDELQSYLIHRVEKYLNSKGRDLIGWDEIMEGGLAPNAAVVSWRGVDGGVKAARSGHKAVMAPGRYCYFDGYQDAPYSQPEAIGGYLPLSLVYEFNPAPDSLGRDVTDYIAGVEATLFTEYIPTDEHAEYMMYPRMTALAEVAWTPQELRNDYPEFRQRALKVNDRMKARGYNVFDLANEIGNRPEAQTPIEHLGRGKTVDYKLRYWGNYPAAGKATLTDGLRGGWNYNDGRWQGFVKGTDERIDVVIDLEKTQPLTYIGADFMQICGPEVWFPARVVISVSDNGTDFTQLKEITYEQIRDDKVSFREYSWVGNTEARYVRYQAFSPQGVLFTDEIVIK